MQASVSALLNAIDNDKLSFDDVLVFIDSNYRYTPTDFSNGEIVNKAGTNEGSARIFGLAKLHGLNQKDTLKLFCEHYQAVLSTPNGHDHPNIRNFMRYGWQGFLMTTNSLSPRH